MGELRLSDINMNLLLALEALLVEANVTRAARRVHVTQSAMSHTLAQLRELLGDPLLIRGRGGMVLTPRAQALAAPLGLGLRQLQRALGEEVGFDPASTTRCFTLAMGDFVSVLLMPALLQRLRAAAPAITLEVAAIDRRRNAELLESGEHDLVVGVRLEPAPGLIVDPLISQRFVCVVREGHPEIDGSISLDQYER
ncbi:MAG TPA: LysR family transcriptional regulator, partial [Nannocystis sp.]